MLSVKHFAIIVGLFIIACNLIQIASGWHIPPNEEDAKKIPAFTKTVMSGNLTRLKEMFAKQPTNVVNEVNKEDQRRASPLHYAILFDHFGTMKFLLEHGANVSARTSANDHKRTPLHWAVELGRAKMVKSLLEAGANPNTKDANGWTALHYVAIAPIHMQRELAVLLLDAGANVKLKNQKDKLPIQMAMESKETSMELLQLLMTNSTGILSVEEQKKIREAESEHDQWWRHVDIADAIAQGYAEVVQKQLDNGIDVNGRSKKRPDISFLGIALENSSLTSEEVVRVLLEHGADVSEPIEEAGEGHLDEPIDSATKLGRPEIIQLLIDNGANVNGKDEFGWTPLHHVATEPSREGMMESLQLLLEKGADLTMRNDAGKLPYEMAIEYSQRQENHISPEIVQMLNPNKEAAVQTTTKAPEEQLPPLHEAVESADLDRVIGLVENGSDVNEHGGPSEFTPLHIAISLENSSDIFNFLLHHGANISAQSKWGATPLHLAIEWKRTEKLKKLLTAKANPNAKDTGGNTTLHYVVTYGPPSKQKNLAELLLKAGADATIKNNEGKLPVEMAVESWKSSRELVQLLREKSAKVLSEKERKRIMALEPEHDRWWQEYGVEKAIENGKKDVLRRLLENGTNPNARSGPIGKTLLAQAIEQGEEEMAKMLIERGAKVDKPVYEYGPNDGDKGRNKEMPLHLAVLNGQIGIIKLLLAHNVNVNARDDWGWTALHYAAAQGRGSMKLVKLLLSAGANPRLRTKDGQLAMDLAAEPIFPVTEHSRTINKADPEVVELLRQKSE